MTLPPSGRKKVLKMYFYPVSLLLLGEALRTEIYTIIGIVHNCSYAPRECPFLSLTQSFMIISILR